MAKKIQFVVMPWHSLHYPSLAVGIMTSIAKRLAPAVEVNTRYANLDWAEFLLERTEGRITPHQHVIMGEDLFFEGVGEWIFSSALWCADGWRVDEFRRYFVGGTPAPATEQNFGMALEAHEHAPEFIARLAQDILETGCDVVGLTSVFSQNVPCLALARKIKELSPRTITIMGGGNCDGTQGIALHRNFPALDFVVTGEGEKAFAGFLEYLDGRVDIRAVPNLCWRQDGKNYVNRTAPLTLAAEMPAPDHHDYFEQAWNSDAAQYYQPRIVVESARGCWWGEKHHCTFCGLNGTGMAFRRKEPEVILDEIQTLVEKHRVLDVILADNIISMDYFKDFLPRLKSRNMDLRLHYEIKANMKKEQLALLRDAGVWHVQPGIESLSTRVLKIMDKGSTGALNVRVLRDCEELNLSSTWNILVGFPGETAEDYQPIIEQMPALFHLQPPSGTARLALERFSPYFNNPALGFTERRPAECFRIIYDLPEHELADLVYVFESPTQGVGDNILQRLNDLADRWQEAYDANSTLTWSDKEACIEIEDNRVGWSFGAYRISDPLYCALLRVLERPLPATACLKQLETLGHQTSLDDIEARLLELKRRGLVFFDGTHYVGLCTQRVPYRIRPTATSARSSRPSELVA
jgi:ribosomal peptide maturation radical SAM protein 1